MKRNFSNSDILFSRICCTSIAFNFNNTTIVRIKACSTGKNIDIGFIHHYLHIPHHQNIRSSIMTTTWRRLGLTYIEYSNIAAKTLRSSLREDQRLLAASRDQSTVRFTKWENGKPIPKTAPKTKTSA